VEQIPCDFAKTALITSSFERPDSIAPSFMHIRRASVGCLHRAYPRVSILYTPPLSVSSVCNALSPTVFLCNVLCFHPSPSLSFPTSSLCYFNATCFPPLFVCPRTQVTLSRKGEDLPGIKEIEYNPVDAHLKVTVQVRR
jgi:hypothetical protein